MNKYLEIINHHGVRKQLKHFISEVHEFSEAVLDYENAKNYVNSEDLEKFKVHIIEEFSDCIHMLLQFKEKYVIRNKDVIDVVEFKNKRTLNKIKEEQVNE